MSQLLFLDTNVFLSFLHFTHDDLEAMRQLTVLVKGRKVNLLLPDQVVHEFRRNRDNKVAQALTRFDDTKLPTEFPRFCQDFPEYKELRERLEDYDKTRRALREKLQAAAADGTFAADTVTEGLFRVASHIEVTDDLFRRAEQRYRRGNPPGKQDKRESLGDSIIWEALLASDTSGDLCMVAADEDWASPLEAIPFNSYLQGEWSDAKDGRVQFYQRLSSYLGEHFPKIKLSSELEKDILIEDLASSPNFTATHAAIKGLARARSDFTSAQLAAISSSYVNNNQVHQIINDSDVRDFLIHVLAGREDEIDEPTSGQLVKVIESQTEPDSTLRKLAHDLHWTIRF